ncbi:MAG: DNA polymerase III subunit delta [Anaerolineae bacterium]|nr:DNA polymerase III subunit delta [Anaerolineae bacterium]
MPDPKPPVYLFHGGDEFSIAAAVSKLEANLGDPTSASMNLTRFDGPQVSLEELEAVAFSAPFLSDRRLVILENPARRYKSAAARERFLALLERIPPTTALVLVETTPLDENDYGKPRVHWLTDWAMAAGSERVFLKKFPALSGNKLANVLREQVQARGGEIEPQAAAHLAGLSGGDHRLASLELDKLLTYVDFNRPIQLEDVDHLSAFAVAQADFFKFIDALVLRDGRTALQSLQNLLEEEDPVRLFFRLVSEFRLLLQVREVLDEGGGPSAVEKKLSLRSSFRAKKLAAHARKLDPQTLAAIYRRLSQDDARIKIGQLDAALALQLLVSSLVSQPA